MQSAFVCWPIPNNYGGTGKENKITIKSNSGLSESEIQQMVNDAEVNAESDKKQVELIQSRNNAEGTSNSFKKDFDEYKDQITEEEKSKAEAALTAIQEAISGDDVEAIRKATTDLYQAMNPITNKKQDAEEKAKKEAEVVDAEVTETV